VNNRSTRFFTLLLLLLTAMNAYTDSNVDAENPAVMSVLAIQEQMHEYAISGDGVSFGELISVDFVASDPSNTIRHRDELIALVSSGRLIYESIETSIDYARQIGNNLVVVMGTESTQQNAVPVDGELEEVALTKTLKRRFTNVFRNEQGSWRLLIKQSTIISVE
jgi:hypothetical protein